MEEKYHRASDQTPQKSHARRQTLIEHCRMIATTAAVENSVDLLIAQDCANQVLSMDLSVLSNNKTFKLLETSERVVSQLHEHSSSAFAQAAWDFNQRVVTAYTTKPSKWESAPWCVPDTLRVGDSPIVVLDTKDWIHISQRENRPHFEALCSHASKGVRFPLSEAVLQELLGGSTIAQRQVIIEAIEALGMSFIQSPDTVWHHEIESALETHIGPDRFYRPPLGPVSYVTDVFGLLGSATPKLRIDRDGQDVTEDYLRVHPEKAAAVKAAQDELPARVAKSFLLEAEKIRWLPLLIDRELVPRFNKAVQTYQEMPPIVRERFLRRLASTLVLIGVKDPLVLWTACAARGKAIREVLCEGLDLYGNSITNVIPSLDSLVLLTEALIQRGQRITRNDLQDAQHLAGTLPYADFVMTDKDMKRRFALSSLISKARAEVVSDMDQLLEGLERMPSSNRSASEG